jgi:phosphoglycerate kinase
MISLPTIDDAGDLAGKRVLLRLDLNAPVIDGKITDTYRIDKIISTLDTLHLKKAKTIIIAHTESNQAGENASLVPMWHYLNGIMPVAFSKDYFSPEAVAFVNELPDGGVLMFENVRTNPGEKTNDPEFAKKLAVYGDIYINEAFSVSHRAHASIVGLPKLLPHYAGPLFVSEVENLSKAFSPMHPFLFIIGGAKFETKLPLIQKFLASADTVFVGGALATDVLKAKGYEVGTSLVSTGEFGIHELLENKKLKYSVDVVIRGGDGSHTVKDADRVEKTDYICDIGPRTVEMLKAEIKKAKFILWNGPVGNYEMGCIEPTQQVATAISQSDAETIVGGGDTLSAIESLGILDTFSFVSTAGGAMLDFLANETLPGIEALQ